MAERAEEKAGEQRKGSLGRLLGYAGKRRSLIVLGCALSAVAMVLSMLPYVCVWQVVRDLAGVAPNWGQAASAASYGWEALWFALAGIAVYFAALACTHLGAYRVASNMRKACVDHLAHTQLGYFDSHATGYLRRRIDGAVSDTETFLAHNLADAVGTVVMLVALVVLLLLFDWRMGLACLACVAVSIASMAAMMAGDAKALMDQMQEALDAMGHAGTEYVRGIPVVKMFQQTVYTCAAFKQAISDYSAKAGRYEGDVCRVPQSVNLTFSEGTLILLIPLVVLIAPGEVDAVTFVVDFAFYAIFSAVIGTALVRVMFMANGSMLADSALERVDEVMAAPLVAEPKHPREPTSFGIEFRDVGFRYPGIDHDALSGLSFSVPQGSTVALVGPSGGGKSTAASLVARLWDACSGQVLIGGVDVRDVPTARLMELVSFVFQDSRLFAQSIEDNVRMGKPGASSDEVRAALAAAQCDDIVARLPQGTATVVGPGGAHLSGGERQRICLARAFLKDAPIVVLDEATAAADPENELAIQQALSRLTAHKTVLMVAHRLSTVVQADQIEVLAKGCLQEQGTHENLLARGGLYAHLWDAYTRSTQWKIASEVA